MTLSVITSRAQQNVVTPGLDARLTRQLESLVRRRRAHHVSVALASGDGSRHWSAVSAAADTEPPPTSDTPFFVASVTKRFIVTLVLQAHERGELDLSAPISRYLPARTLTGLHVLHGVDHTPKITVRHLASHTSGLPDHFESRRGEPSLDRQLRSGHDVAWTFDDLIRTTRERQRPHFEPQDLTAARQRARYSDTGFQLLVRMLETVAGRSFGELLTERVTGPLGLTRTWLPNLPRPDAAAAPMPLHTRHHPVSVPSILESSNDLFSTTGDLLTFQRALLAGELFEHSGTRELLTERRNRLRNIPILRYGLGTMFFDVNRLAAGGRAPVTLVGHSGVTGSWLFYCPELDLHLAGTVDRIDGRALPFRLMARLSRSWRT